MMLIWLPRLPMPIKKLSGLMSRWMKLREWMYSMREIWGRPKGELGFGRRA